MNGSDFSQVAVVFCVLKENTWLIKEKFILDISFFYGIMYLVLVDYTPYNLKGKDTHYENR